MPTSSTSTPASKADGLKKAQSYYQGNRETATSRSKKQRPVAVRVMLEDSPVASLARMYEKLAAWTDGYPWTDNEVIPAPVQPGRAGPAAGVRRIQGGGGLVASASLFTAGRYVQKNGGSH